MLPRLVVWEAVAGTEEESLELLDVRETVWDMSEPRGVRVEEEIREDDDGTFPKVTLLLPTAVPKTEPAWAVGGDSAVDVSACSTAVTAATTPGRFGFGGTSSGGRGAAATAFSFRCEEKNAGSP